MLNPFKKIGTLLTARARANERLSFASERTDLGEDLSFTEAARRYGSRNDLFAYMHRYFYTQLPEELRAHRAYFSEQGRGFGEEAFHSMWYLLLREFRPSSALEIGVFRGQVISLWALIAREIGLQLSVRCISPFSAAGDLVSQYPNLDYLEDMRANFRHFGLTPPQHWRGFSTDPGAIEFLKREPLDLIYIDGGHDYEVVRSDYRNSVEALKPGGILVMDDSSLETNFTPPSFSFAGHPGPSRVARELADKELQALGGVGHQNVYRKPL
ncbi:MAG TPA: class I SAM-dependent methyltransferase [Steroidobacteraceae bacterium]|jgi:predicted O-methyltransferase YrrM